MTFANMVVPVRSKDDPEAKKKFFDDRLQQWTEQLQEALKEAGVTNEIVEKVNIVPVGYYKDPSLLPNGQENWLTVFWLVCLQAMKKQAQPALLKVNLNRLKSVQEVVPSEDYTLPFYRQPIVVDTLRKTVVPGATGLVGGAIGLGVPTAMPGRHGSGRSDWSRSRLFFCKTHDHSVVIGAGLFPMQLYSLAAHSYLYYLNLTGIAQSITHTLIS